MSTEIIVITKADFDQFKQELITELREKVGINITKTKWLRSKDVREMLGISDSTLQTMRINNTFPAYKLDSSWFYKYDEIVSALEKGKVWK